MNTAKRRWTFISYSRKDKEFALQLARELKSAGHLVWLDQLDILTGARWDDAVERTLSECEIFLIILTSASISSENVKDEIGYAIDHGKSIMPVLLEECDIPLRLRRFQYVDFTKMKLDEGVERAKQLLSSLTNARATISLEQIDIDSIQVERVQFDAKIELIKDEIRQLHTQYNQKLDGIMPLNSLLPILKTFHESVADCQDENWHDRLCATVQVEYFLNVYWHIVKEAAAAVADHQSLLSYESVQKELRRYSQELIGMFGPHSIIADIEEALLLGKLDDQKAHLFNSRIIPIGKVPKRVIQNCDTHRQAILQEIESWPIL